MSVRETNYLNSHKLHFIFITTFALPKLRSEAEEAFLFLFDTGGNAMQILSGRNEVLKPEFYPKPRFLSVTLFYMPSPHCNGTPLQNSCLENPMDRGAWWAAVHGVARSRTRLSDFTFTFHFQALEKEMATHSSVLAWRIPGTGEPGGLPSMGSHRVRHD